MMKNKKNLLSVVFIIMLLVVSVIFQVNDLSKNMKKLSGDISYPTDTGAKISCDSTNLSIGGTTTCTLTGFLSGGASGAYGRITSSGNITVSNITPSTGWQNYGSVPDLSLGYTAGSAVTPSNTFIIATMTVKAESAGSGTVTFGPDSVSQSAYFVTSSDSRRTIENAFCTINVSNPTPTLSNESRLSNLTVSNTSLSFNPNTKNYNLSVDNSVSSVTVSATAMDSKAKGITGVGTHSLNTGSNTISVVVTAEDNSTSTYTINITRGANSNTNLSSLSVSNTNIAGEFINSTTTYSKDVANNVSSVVVKATPVESTTSIVYKGTTKSTLTETVQLEVGSNVIEFTVKAQNGATKNFKITINRLSADTANCVLKTLKVTNTDIESKFKASTLYYNATVANSVTSVKITATAASGLTITGTGTKSLKVGDNIYNIIVTNQNGSNQTYNIRITRQSQKDSSSSGGSSSGSGENQANKSGGSSSSSTTNKSTNNNNSNSNNTTPAKDNNSLLKNLTINNKEIMLSDSVYKYNYSVLNAVTKLNIVATAKSDKSKVDINKPDKLEVGQNDVTIKVTAEDGSETTYKIVVTRKDANEELSSDSKLTSVSIEKYDLDFDRDTYDYELKIKNENKLKISYVASGVNTNVIIKNNEKLKNNSVISIVVTAEDGVSTSTYNIRVKKSISPVIIISLIILLLLAALLAFYFLYLKKRLPHKTKEIPVGTSDESSDFEEISETPITEPIEVPTEASVDNNTEEIIETVSEEPAQEEQPTEKVDETTNN